MGGGNDYIQGDRQESNKGDPIWSLYIIVCIIKSLEWLLRIWAQWKYLLKSAVNGEFAISLPFALPLRLSVTVPYLPADKYAWLSQNFNPS